MSLIVRDGQVRLFLSCHLASQLASGAEPKALGLNDDGLDRLRKISVAVLVHLAAIPDISVDVSFDLTRIEAALQSITLIKNAKALESYFIRHGASSRLMRALFRIRRGLRV